MPVIGVLNTTSPSGRAHLLAAFLQGVREAGYVEGRSVTIEYRSVRLVASVAWPLATVVAKRTQRLHGVWD
jgi:hypothetical protein